MWCTTGAVGGTAHPAAAASLAAALRFCAIYVAYSYSASSAERHSRANSEDIRVDAMLEWSAEERLTFDKVKSRSPATARARAHRRPHPHRRTHACAGARDGGQRFLYDPTANPNENAIRARESVRVKFGHTSALTVCYE